MLLGCIINFCEEEAVFFKPPFSSCVRNFGWANGAKFTDLLSYVILAHPSSYQPPMPSYHPPPPVSQDIFVKGVSSL